MKREFYIEFTSPDKPFQPVSWAIRKVSKRPYSHVRVRWINTTNRNIVYEASGSNIHFLGTEAQPDHPVFVHRAFKVTLQEGEYRKLVDVCMQYAGVKYGYHQLVGIGVAKMFGLDDNPLSKGIKKQVCSEIVARVLSRVKGWDVDADLDLAGPKEIDDMLTALCDIQMDIELVS